MRTTATLAALLLLAGCAGNDTLKYGERTVEPKAVFFAPLPADPSLGGDQPESVVVVITDYGSMCSEFDGLACLPQPLLGGTVTFTLSKLANGRYSVPDSARATWIDFKEPRAYVREATAGTIEVQDSKENSHLNGHLDVTLPEAQVSGAFAASYCRQMRDYFYRCQGGPL